METSSYNIPADKIKVLIVDDEKPFLQFLREVISSASYNVIAESNSANVINLAIGMQPDLILLDVGMPKYDGFTICKKLKKTPQTKHIPIIFLTIDDKLENKLTGLDIGCVDYLLKSLDSKELLARIKLHIDISISHSNLEKQINDQESELETLKAKLKNSEKFIFGSNSLRRSLTGALESAILTINNNLKCITANDSAAFLLGYDSSDDLIGKKIIDQRTGKYNRKSDIKGEDGNFKKEKDRKKISLTTKSGEILKAEIELISSFDANRGNIATIKFINISFDELNIPRFATPLYKDHLTQVFNKMAFYRIIDHYRKKAQSKDGKDAIYILDLNNFKEINDGFGHLIGDEVLCQIATRLQFFVRKEDTVARLGGDEFGLILEKMPNSADIEQQADRLVKFLSQPIKLKNATIMPSACVGIAVLDQYIESAEAAVERADMALYRAKNTPGIQFSLFDATLKQKLEEELFFEKQLPQIIQENQLYMEYQPQFSISENKYIGAEALIRWNHPSRGKLLPINFLPIAEKRGFIRDISNYSFKKVLEQIKDWKKNNVKFGTISINICSAQLADDNFFHEVKSLLEKHHINSGDFLLELTENTLLSINNETRKRLLKFSKLGVKFAIDDFGKGFSSMQLLKDMDSEHMKIDKEFVQDIETNKKSRIIIKSIIKLSKDLNINVIAEGVENKRQLDFLKESGCNSFQGFYLGEAVSPKILQQMFL